MTEPQQSWTAERLLREGFRGESGNHEATSVARAKKGDRTGIADHAGTINAEQWRTAKKDDTLTGQEVILETW